MEKAVTECPLCHSKRHSLTKCGYALRAGFVCQHKPDKAATQLAALNLERRPPKPATGKCPSASLTSAPLAPPPPALSSPPPSTPTHPQPPMAEEDDEEIRTAAAEVMQEEREEDSAKVVSITDDEASLVELPTLPRTQP